MDIASGLKVVLLPDGEMTISTVPVPWWTQQNGTGFIDPENIAPDPKNVRRRVNKSKMEGLRSSVKKHGVLQPMNMTPLHMAPWVQVEPKFRNCFFLAVGGHRRREAATLEHIAAVPVLVKIYASEKEHRMDVSLLNKENEDLTDLEKGYEIVNLQELGWKVDELCKEFKYTTPALYVRIHLTRLYPGLQALLEEELPFKLRLGTILGGEIGSTKEPTLEELDDFYVSLADSLKLVPQDHIVPYQDIEGLDGDGRRFAMQRAMYAIIRIRNLSADRAKAFVDDHRLRLQASGRSGGKKTERFQPQRRKDLVSNMSEMVDGTLPAGWDEAEWRRIFMLSSREETETYLAGLRKAEDKFRRMGDLVERIMRGKHATRPEVLALMDRNRNKL